MAPGYSGSARSLGSTAFLPMTAELRRADGSGRGEATSGTGVAEEGALSLPDCRELQLVRLSTRQRRPRAGCQRMKTPLPGTGAERPSRRLRQVGGDALALLCGRSEEHT